MKPIVYETHCHTPLCRHADGESQEYAEQAFQRNLAGIIFTCHCPLQQSEPERKIRMDIEMWPHYVELIQQTRAHWAGKLDVRLGIESDYFPENKLYDFLETLHASAPLDQVLGSVHCQMKEIREFYGSLSDLDYQRRYFQLLAESAECGLYDIVTHPDLVKNLFAASWNVTLVLDDIRHALDRIAKTGIVMELNTSGLLKSYPEMNPSVTILQEMHARGIPISVGADAHVPERVADHFEEAFDLLQEIGFTHTHYFIERKRVAVELSQARQSLKSVKNQ